MAASTRQDVGRMRQRLLVGASSESSRFVKRRQLGSSVRCCSWKVEDPTSGVYYAAKVYELQSLTPIARAFAEHEVRALARCSHPNVMRSVEVERDGDASLTLVMEYADAGDMYRQVKARQERDMRHFAEHEVAFIFFQACLGLAALHAQNIVHRGVATHNLMLSIPGVVKLSDVALSARHESDDPPVGHRVTRPAVAFQPPEVLRQRPFTWRGDVWALGCVLYQVMALRHPFGARDVGGMIDNVLHVQYDPLPDRYSAELRNLVAVLLQPDPDRRPSVNQILCMDFARQHLQAMRRGMEANSRICDGAKMQLIQTVDAALALSEGIRRPLRTMSPPAVPVFWRAVSYNDWHAVKLRATASTLIVVPIANEARVDARLDGIASACVVDDNSTGASNRFAVKDAEGVTVVLRTDDHDEGSREWVAWFEAVSFTQ